MTIEEIFKNLKAGNYSPVYFLCGEEPYYIDQLANYIEQNILTDDQKEFNQSVLYGIETSVSDAIAVAKRFPLMSDYQVVVIKEAQLMKKIEEFESYIKKPQKSTILVICYKGKEPDKRKSFGKMLEKETVYLRSDRLKDEKIPEWISNYLFKKGYKIEAKAALMMAEFVGNDLEKVANEAEKLMVNFPEGHPFSEKDIEKIVGVSKEYNVFELQKAIAVKDIYKTNKIAFYMAANSKSHPIQMILGYLIGYFSKILHYQWLKKNGERDIAKSMGIPPFFMREYDTASKNYSPAKVIRIIHHLRDYDLKSKGVNNDSASGGDLLIELVFKILH